MPVGDFTLTAISRGLPGSAAGRINSGNEVMTVDIALLGSGASAGTVFDIDGATPVPNALVGIMSDITGNSFTTTADASGNYNSNSGGYIPIGGFTIVAYDPVNKRYGIQRGVITNNNETVTVNASTTTNTGSVRVTTHDETGVAPIANARLRIEDMFYNLVYEGITDANGQVIITSFPVLGKFRINADKGIYWGESEGMITEQGQIVEINIIMVAGGEG